MEGNIIYIWGSEAYLVDEEIRKITSSFSGDELATIYLEVENLNGQELLQLLDFSPLFALQRVVVIKNPYWFEKVRRPQVLKEIVQALEEYAKNSSPMQTVVITGLTNNTSNPVIGWLNQKARVIKCENPGPMYLRRWIKEEFARRGKRVTEEGASFLAQSGQDMYYMLNLLEKMALIKGDDKEVTLEEIKEELESGEEIKVFKFTDAFLKRDQKEAFAAYYRLREQGASTVFILYMTVRQFLALAKVKFYMEKGYSRQEIEEKTGLKDFVISKMAAYSRNFTAAEVETFFTWFLEADLALKSSEIAHEDIIMEMLISQIAAKK
ncbi:DNA polymerase III, delta subunit [Thermosyntropha lipolytica DSM 11003]|uniref:DNA polymerase III subunit delta n=1 Tax=Thermosyntropha lipolytica DSM 11003 TaxID=1123382 RepID=A0A1M5N6T4_9FIRM|nr:DNA polymerase III subunit delta [Thermosyntropha lipolytica]SHG85142.1 DNA polymerase III, delta subunit [Thermosyntropha lipolytica DSM 11003]